MKSTISREFQGQIYLVSPVGSVGNTHLFCLTVSLSLFARYFSAPIVREESVIDLAFPLCSNDQDWFAFYFYADALMYLIYLLQYPAVLVHIEFLISDTARNNKKRYRGPVMVEASV